MKETTGPRNTGERHSPGPRIPEARSTKAVVAHCREEQSTDVVDHETESLRDASSVSALRHGVVKTMAPLMNFKIRRSGLPHGAERSEQESISTVSLPGVSDLLSHRSIASSA